MSRLRGADHSHKQATVVRAGYQHGHSKVHPSDKREESPAVARLRERMSKVRV